jgi:hypothetical protein
MNAAPENFSSLQPSAAKRCSVTDLYSSPPSVKHEEVRPTSRITGRRFNGTTSALLFKALNPDYSQKRGRKEMFDKFREREHALTT